MLNVISPDHIFRDCKVISDMATGKSKGYGFISFVNKEVSSHCCTIKNFRRELFSNVHFHNWYFLVIL